MSPLMQDLISTASKNQFLIGGVGAGLVGYVLVQARSLPHKAWSVLLDQFTVHLTIRGEDTISQHFNDWFAAHPSTKKIRKLATTGEWVHESHGGARPWEDDTVSRYIPKLIPGPGSCWMWHKGMPLHVTVTESEKGTTENSNTSSAARVITTTIVAPGRSRKIFDSILQEVQEGQEEDRSLKMYVWRGGAYVRIKNKLPRPLSTMFIDPEIRDEVLSDARRFFANGSWYTGMGIPHRRGYLLDGPPGTGKSSLILALASELNKPLYIINAQTLSDDSLAEAFQRAQSGIVVLEDIDTVTITKARVDTSGGDDKAAPTASLSLSGLLNAIDGLYASEGRLLFMTSNKPQSLDPALVRPGRIDRQFHIGYLTEHLASMMTAKFLPPASDFFERVVLPLMKTTPLSGATLQNMLLKELHRLEFPDEADQQVEPPGASGPSPVGGQLQPGNGGYFGYWPAPAPENCNSTGRI